MGVEELSMFDERGAVLPYAGTSGWSGSVTSKSRASVADSAGLTRARQGKTLASLRRAAQGGLTWLELAEEQGWHHGTASGSLSLLHKEGFVARLAMSRNRSRIYVLPEFIDGRDIEGHGRKPKPCPNCGHES